MLKFIFWLVFALILFSRLEEIDDRIASIDSKLSTQVRIINN